MTIFSTHFLDWHHFLYSQFPGWQYFCHFLDWHHFLFGHFLEWQYCLYTFLIDIIFLLDLSLSGNMLVTFFVDIIFFLVIVLSDNIFYTFTFSKVSSPLTWLSYQNDRSLFQNTVSFIGLFCKRDLSFSAHYSRDYRKELDASSCVTIFLMCMYIYVYREESVLVHGDFSNDSISQDSVEHILHWILAKTHKIPQVAGHFPQKSH